MVRRRLLVLPTAGLLVASLLGAGRRATGLDEAPPAPAAQVAAEVDAHLREAWQAADATPAPPAEDATFLRRATLDLTGTLPTPDEARAFVADPAPAKRERLLRRLLDSPGAARHFAAWYGRLLLGRANVDPRRREALEGFLAAAWRDGLSYDRLVSALVAARGAVDEHGEAAYVAQFAQDGPALAGRTARLFLGVRVACAQCHDHPFDRWTQRDFAGLLGFFARTRVEKIATPVDRANGLNARAEQQARALSAALEKARADLAAGKEAAAKAEAARAAAEKAHAPLAERLKAAQAAAEKERATAAALSKDAEDAAAAAREAESRAAAAALPEPLRAAAREQAALAKELAAQAGLAAREQAAVLGAHEAKVKQAQAAAQATGAALAQAQAALSAAAARRAALEASVNELPLLLARAERLRESARRLAATVPDVLRARHLLAGLSVAPDRFRVLDQPGKVEARAVNPAKAHEGDGRPRVLDGEPVAAGLGYERLRSTLAAWITAPTNPTFARAAVNRFAAHLYGRGLIDPVDDVGDPDRALSRPALETLERDFVASGFDLRRLLLVLALASPYQAASRGGTGPAEVPLLRAPVRELQPEVLFRALTQALLPDLPGPDRAGLGASDEGLRGAARLFDDGEDRPATTPRSGMRAALWLENGGPLAGAIAGRGDALARRLAAPELSAEQALERAYLACLSRLPTEAERTLVLATLPRLPAGGDGAARSAAVAARQQVLEDLLAALTRSTEFLTNH